MPGPGLALHLPWRPALSLLSNALINCAPVSARVLAEHVLPSGANVQSWPTGMSILGRGKCPFLGGARPSG